VNFRFYADGEFAGLASRSGARLHLFRVQKYKKLARVAHENKLFAVKIAVLRKDGARPVSTLRNKARFLAQT
jgi:hypothetical protein